MSAITDLTALLGAGPTGPRGIDVVLVDDNADTWGREVQNALPKHRVLPVADVAQFSRLLDSEPDVKLPGLHKPRLAILDLILGSGPSGLAALCELRRREQFCDVVVVLLTTDLLHGRGLYPLLCAELAGDGILLAEKGDKDIAAIGRLADLIHVMDQEDIPLKPVRSVAGLRWVPQLVINGPNPGSRPRSLFSFLFKETWKPVLYEQLAIRPSFKDACKRAKIDSRTAAASLGDVLAAVHALGGDWLQLGVTLDLSKAQQLPNYTAATAVRTNLIIEFVSAYKSVLRDPAVKKAAELMNKKERR